MGKYHPGALPISAMQNLSRLSILGVNLKPEVVEGALKTEDNEFSVLVYKSRWGTTVLIIIEILSKKW